MALIATITLIVLLVAVRLLVAPVPSLFTKYAQRWGTRTTILLCMVSLVSAALVIFISARR